MRRFHELETASARSTDLARVVSHTVGQHSPTPLESLADVRRIAILETFNDHEEHERECTPARAHFELTRCKRWQRELHERGSENRKQAEDAFREVAFRRDKAHNQIAIGREVVKMARMDVNILLGE
jgi:hypothetical protein